MQIDLTKSIKKESQNDDLLNSTKLIWAALKEKVKSFNSISDKKINSEQLKDIFLSGASTKIENQPILNCGFARINMFLRLLKNNSIASELKSNLKKSTNIKIGNKVTLDFSNYLNPSEEDFVLAAEDIKNFNLNFSINNVDELYFSNQKATARIFELI